MKDVHNFYIALKDERTFEPIDGCPMFNKADTIRRWMCMHKPEYTENCSVSSYGVTKNLIKTVNTTTPYYIGSVYVNANTHRDKENETENNQHLSIFRIIRRGERNGACLIP